MLALKTVLVATDLRDDSLPSINVGHTISHAAGATLHIVHVGDPDGTGSKAHEQLGQLGIRLDEAAVHTLPGEPVAGVVRIAEELNADVIVVGPHGGARSKDQRSELGTALKIATRSSVPCLVIGRDAHIPVRRVVVGIDGSETSRGALVVALAWASGLRDSRISAPEGTSLIALYVNQSSGATMDSAKVLELVRQRVEKLRQDAGSWSGVDIRCEVVDGNDVSDSIAQYCKRNAIDLIVVGTRGIGIDKNRRLGSVSEAVTQKVDVPVLLVPPAVWQRFAQSSDPEATETSAAA